MYPGICGITNIYMSLTQKYTINLGNVYLGISCSAVNLIYVPVMVVFM